MQKTAREIAQFLGGEIEGNPDIILTRPSKIEEGVPGAITFLSNPKYEEFIYKTKASAVLVNSRFKPSAKVDATLIRVQDVYGAITKLLSAFNNNGDTERIIHPDAQIAESATIGKKVGIGMLSVVEEGAEIGDDSLIYPQVYIGKNVKIGDGAKIYPGVRIMHDCILGDNCIIHSNTIIGSDGFGFSPNENGQYSKIPQIGNVLIGDDVEIGANSVIDRATMGSTIIESGVKLDNLIQIGHNVSIGKNTVMAAQVGIAGSTKIGKNCVIGGQVGISGHLQIADSTSIAGQSGVMRSVKEKGTNLFGSPAFAYGDFLKSYVGFKKLPDVLRKIEQLEKEVRDLKGK